VKLIIVLLLSGCAGQTTVEIALGQKAHGEWVGDGGVVDAAIRRHGDMSFCELRHTSNLTSGWPFNDRYENHITRVSCGMAIPVF